MTSIITSRRAVLGAAGGLLAGVGRPAQAQSGGLVLATFGGPYEDILRKQNILSDFDRANNTQTRMEFGSGTTFIQRMLASRMRSPYSVIYLNEDEALVGEEANLFAPLQPGRVPNLSQIYDQLKPPAVHMYGTMFFELTCVYNSSTMPEPKSWADLWKPGVRVGVCHPTNAYGLLFLQVAAELAGHSGERLSDGFPMIKKLENYKLYRGVVDGIQLFRQGEIDAALFYRNRAIQLADEGFPIKHTAPKEGAFGIRSGVQVARTTPNQDLAFRWVNNAMSAPYQRHFADGLYSPANKTVELPPELAAKHIYGEAELNKLRFLDWSNINRQKQELYARWDREFAR